MPRKKKENDSSDESFQNEADDSAKDDDEESWKEERASKKKTTKKSSPIKKNTKRKRNDGKSQKSVVVKAEEPDSSAFDDNEDEDDVPKPTPKGGYSHTKSSKAKIGMANKGNIPWNKGKARSEEAKARIKAGVRARNRAVLMEKLKKLNMTEEEWLAKKKEIKLLREVIRKRKLKAANEEKMKKDATNKRTKTDDEETRLSNLLCQIDPQKGPTNKSTAVAAANKLSDKSATTNAEQATCPVARNKVKSGLQVTEASAVTDVMKQEEEKPEKMASPPATQLSREVQFTPHEFDDGKRACPNGGPGGLTCCETCSTKYSCYLTLATRDIEVHTNRVVGQETMELMDFLKESHQRLQRAVDVARSVKKKPRDIECSNN